jgi:hypothetical protein
MVWDIVQPKNKWERDYARLEYLRILWAQLWQPAKYIEITHVEAPQTVLDVLDLDNTTCEWARDTGALCSSADYPEMCANCLESRADAMNQMAEDRYRDR